MNVAGFLASGPEPNRRHDADACIGAPSGTMNVGVAPGPTGQGSPSELIPMRKLLRTAIERHRSGRLDEAASLYRHVLANEPENAEALHWLGVLHHQAGDPARAVELIGRAVALKPEAYLYHGNLAESYRATGDHQRSAESGRAALRIWPDYPEALCSLGTALSAMKRHAEAVESLRRAVEVRPGFVVAHNNLGIALRELGKSQDALEHFRRAVELEPAYAAARTNLGQVLLARGQSEEALAHCQEAVRLDASSAELHDNLGNVLRVMDRLDEAWGALRSRHPPRSRARAGHAHIGLIFRERGHLGEAVYWLDRAIEQDPNCVEFWEWLAELHDHRDDPAASIPCWERVLALDPDRAGAHLSLGRALQDEGQLEDARARYLAADRLQPQSGAPLLNLGWLHELMGEMDQAESAFRTALKRQPDFPAPHARLATLLRGKLPDPDLAALEARLADADLAPGPRARLLFGLAHVLDGRGDYARAAECLARANAITLELDRGRHDYSPAEHERHVDRLVRSLRSRRLHPAGRGGPRHAPAGLRVRPAAVGNNPGRAGPGEPQSDPRSGRAAAGPALVRGPPGRHGPDHRPLGMRPPDGLGRGATPRGAASQPSDRDRAGPSRRIVDKMPENYLYLGLLSILFPRATFIHCRRDLRDVAVSCWMTDFSSIRWANDFGQIAARFRQYRRIMDHWRAVVNPLILHVDYEQTVRDLEGVGAG